MRLVAAPLFKGVAEEEEEEKEQMYACCLIIFIHFIYLDFS